jgi:hypothetical protein
VPQGTFRYANCPHTFPLTPTPSPREHKGAVLCVTHSLSSLRQQQDDGKAVQLGTYTTAPRARFPHTSRVPHLFSVVV